MTWNELKALLQAERRRLGSDLALARAIGLRGSNHIPRLLNVNDPITPSVETCLRIAALTTKHPSEILKAAGHDDVIPTLEMSYGPERLKGRRTVAQDDNEELLIYRYRMLAKDAPEEAKLWVDLLVARSNVLPSRLARPQLGAGRPALHEKTRRVRE